MKNPLVPPDHNKITHALLKNNYTFLGNSRSSTSHTPTPVPSWSEGPVVLGVDILPHQDLARGGRRTGVLPEPRGQRRNPGVH